MDDAELLVVVVVLVDCGLLPYVLSTRVSFSAVSLFLCICHGSGRRSSGKTLNLKFLFILVGCAVSFTTKPFRPCRELRLLSLLPSGGIALLGLDGLASVDKLPANFHFLAFCSLPGARLVCSVPLRTVR